MAASAPEYKPNFAGGNSYIIPLACIKDRDGAAAKTLLGGFVAALAAIEPGPRVLAGEMPDC